MEEILELVSEAKVLAEGNKELLSILSKIESLASPEVSQSPEEVMAAPDDYNL